MSLSQVQVHSRSAQNVLTSAATMQQPLSLNESDTEDSFMKRIIMHNRSQSEDVLRPQPFSRAQVRPRNNPRLTLANLERLPVPEPPQVTSKSDIGSIGSRSSSERSRNKLADIRERELALFEQSEDEEEEQTSPQKQELDTPKVLAPIEEAVRKISPSHDALRNLALQQNRHGSRERVRLQEQGRNQSHERLRIHEQRQTLLTVRRTDNEEKEQSQERSRSRPKRDEPVPKESAPKLIAEVARQVEAELFTKSVDEAVANVDIRIAKGAVVDPVSQGITSKPISKEPAQKEASTIPTPEPSPEPQLEAIRAPVRKPLEAQRPAPQVRVTAEGDEDSDLIHITRMGNRLESLSTNLNDVKAGMENISKMTGQPLNGTLKGGNLLPVRISDREVFEAVTRATWSSLWVAQRDEDSWKGFRLGPGFWLLMLLAIPFYAMLEIISCMIWCRPVFADDMEGLGTYPDAPELPFVIPTMLLRPLRPVWKPVIEIMGPTVQWLWEFFAYITATEQEYGHGYE